MLIATSFGTAKKRERFDVGSCQAAVCGFFVLLFTLFGCVHVSWASGGASKVTIPDVEKVLQFWFPENLSSDHEVLARQFEWWFRGGADAEIFERFVPLLEQASRGELDHWAESPRGRLALIIVLDQFSLSEVFEFFRR